MHKKYLILISLFLIGCPTYQDVIRPEPKEPDDTEWCKAGCEHLATLPGQDGKLGCLEARPLKLPDGEVISCEQFCIETQQNGRALSPKCWVELNSCDQIEKVCRHGINNK